VLSLDAHPSGTCPISSFNRNEIPMKNDQDSTLGKIWTKTTCNNNKTHTDEEGWTTTSPGKRKPRKNNNKVASIESIITTIDGSYDQIEAGIHNRISVTSPGRKHKCNIPEKMHRTNGVEFNPIITMTNTTGNGEEQNKEVSKDSVQEQNNNSSIERDGSKKKDERNNNDNKEERKDNKNESDQRGRGGGRGGRKGRGGRGGRTGRKQIPRSDWETYNFAI
jgi:hypothetical protein